MLTFIRKVNTCPLCRLKLVREIRNLSWELLEQCEGEMGWLVLFDVKLSSHPRPRCCSESSAVLQLLAALPRLISLWFAGDGKQKRGTKQIALKMQS